MSREKRQWKTPDIHPQVPVRFIKNGRLINLSPSQVRPAKVGWKAYGESCLPSEWVPPFLVVSSSSFGKSDFASTVALIQHSEFDLGDPQGETTLMIRSSGTDETIQTRGLLVSCYSERSSLLGDLEKIRNSLPVASRPKVHWIVQAAVTVRRKGHLSNERRLSEEDRDWVAEMEPTLERPGRADSIAIRRWRDGRGAPYGELHCKSEAELSIRLKQVAIWGSDLGIRAHFEWVWDGRRIYVVQFEREIIPKGRDPRSCLPSGISVSRPHKLRAFRRADPTDYKSLRKLRNASLYTHLGYEMPPFYVLSGQEWLLSIIGGSIPDGLSHDLAELTKRPLVLRTDGQEIPRERQEMLPRSDELRSVEEAVNWLLGSFKGSIIASGLFEARLSLIAHHFIPSVASAWARATPESSLVRIESLWGIPEGLYWYSHDTFEVDVQVAPAPLGPPSVTKARLAGQRLRYKGSFVAPNDMGKWIPEQTEAPFDWRRSIRLESWLEEIGCTTWKVAEAEKRAVSVMWFIDNHSAATKHKILPWFHSESPDLGSVKAAPRNKIARDSDFLITTRSDWARLKTEIKSGRRIERVVVEPRDADMIRDPTFAGELGTLAVSERFVIHLSGGILSHAFYVLTRSGARVECADLFGLREEIVDFNKIVRDGVPEIIGRRGERAEVIRLEGEALIDALKKKLVEEALEALDSTSGTDLIGELADIVEVVRGVGTALGIDQGTLEREIKTKRRLRGGFDGGLMLRRTATPHSLTRQGGLADGEPPFLVEMAEQHTIHRLSELPAPPLYRRPDVRKIGAEDEEKLFTFATAINALGKVSATVTFQAGSADGTERSWSLTVELQRKGSTVRGTVRVRPLPTQLELRFERE